jgi:hypothetical protein
MCRRRLTLRHQTFIPTPIVLIARYIHNFWISPIGNVSRPTLPSPKAFTKIDKMTQIPDWNASSTWGNGILLSAHLFSSVTDSAEQM